MATCTATTRLTLSPFDRDEPDVLCTRETDADGRHIGSHQGLNHHPARPANPAAMFPSAREARGPWDSLVTWDEGGAQSQRYHPDEPNTNCSCAHERVAARVGHRPEDHHWTTCNHCGAIMDSTTPTPTLCHTCSYWSVRVRDYAKVGTKGERFVRPHHDSIAGQPWLYVWSPSHGGAFGGRQFKVTWDDGTTVGPADFLWTNGRIPWWLQDQFPPNATVGAAEKIARPGHTTGFDGAGTPLTYTAHPGRY